MAVKNYTIQNKVEKTIFVLIFMVLLLIINIIYVKTYNNQLLILGLINLIIIDVLVLYLIYK